MSTDQRTVTDDLAGDTVFRPVRAGNAFEETVERLLQAIKLRVVAFEDRFPPERELAVRLGISRITLREAIRALTQAGYVESRRGRFGGTFVIYRPPAPSRGALRRMARDMGDELADALTFRRVVEVGAAQVLAELMRDEPRADREQVLLRRLAAVNEARPDDYRRHDTMFHLGIAELTGSRMLTESATEARMRLNDLLAAIPVLSHNIAHTAAQHQAICDAIRAGDPDGAGRAVTEHLAGTAALLRGFLG